MYSDLTTGLGYLGYVKCFYIPGKTFVLFASLLQYPIGRPPIWVVGDIRAAVWYFRPPAGLRPTRVAYFSYIFRCEQIHTISHFRSLLVRVPLLYDGYCSAQRE